MRAIGQPRTATRSLLIVDPDPDTCALYTTSLGLWGWEGMGVGDGREALAKAIAYRPTAVVTETRVPGLDGFELCRILRRDPATQHTPIVVVTGDAAEHDIDRATEAGADAVLVKPCLPVALLSAIEAALGLTAAQRLARIEADHTGSSARAKSRSHRRGETTVPPVRPPSLVCPTCGAPLVYHLSHIGGVSVTLREQWDDYTCSDNCGRFEYRHRTRKIRMVD